MKRNKKKELCGESSFVVSVCRFCGFVWWCCVVRVVQYKSQPVLTNRFHPLTNRFGGATNQKEGVGGLADRFFCLTNQKFQCLVVCFLID